MEIIKYFLGFIYKRKGQKKPKGGLGGMHGIEDRIWWVWMRSNKIFKYMWWIL